MNKQQLKEVAQLANELGGIAKYLRGKQAMHKFLTEFTPAVVAMVLEQLEAAERERDELRAKVTELNKQWDNRSPTPFAYDAACKALDKHRARADEAERERDVLQRNQELNLKIKQAMHERLTRAEAELARRDVAAGEPVAVISDDSLAQLKESYRPVLAFRPDHKRESQGVELYTATPPAVVPPEMVLTDDLQNHQWADRAMMLCRLEGYNQCRADALALGAQQQKVVELPHPFAWSPSGTKYFSEEQVLALLDAAGVKWVQK